MKVREVMTADVVTIGRNDPLAVAEDVMKSRKIRHFPVVEEGRLVGILTQRDMFQAALSNTMGFGEKARKEFQCVRCHEFLRGTKHADFDVR